MIVIFFLSSCLQLNSNLYYFSSCIVIYGYYNSPGSKSKVSSQGEFFLGRILMPEWVSHDIISFGIPISCTVPYLYPGDTLKCRKVLLTIKN